MHISKTNLLVEFQMNNIEHLGQLCVLGSMDIPFIRKLLQHVILITFPPLVVQPCMNMRFL